MEQGHVHRSVLLDEAIAALDLSEGDRVVDCTFGRGGHSRAILDRIGQEGRLLAVDKDLEAIESIEAKSLSGDSRFQLHHGSFAQIRGYLEQNGWWGQVDAMLMDLGVSSPQLDQAERGFSFMREGPLDMRMDRTRGMSAAVWLQAVSEEELANVLWTFGEERFSRRIARTGKDALRKGPVETTTQLVRLIEAAGVRKEPGKHPATRSFQAIRIAVNEELKDLQSGLKDALEGLASGGRLAVISFHSLEDRIVKRFFRDEERGWAAGQRPAFPIVGEVPGRVVRAGKSVRASALEVEANPRARSAILRVARKR